jgi:hypothetical protein
MAALSDTARRAAVPTVPVPRCVVPNRACARTGRHVWKTIDQTDDHNRRRPVLPSHQTLEERIQMDDHPEREEERELPEERAP